MLTSWICSGSFKTLAYSFENVGEYVRSRGWVAKPRSAVAWRWTRGIFIIYGEFCDSAAMGGRPTGTCWPAFQVLLLLEPPFLKHWA